MLKLSVEVCVDARSVDGSHTTSLKQMHDHKVYKASPYEMQWKDVTTEREGDGWRGTDNEGGGKGERENSGRRQYGC